MPNELKCENCGYFYKDSDEDDYPYCHWKERCPGDIAPCEEEPYWEEREDWLDWRDEEELEWVEEEGE